MIIRGPGCHESLLEAEGCAGANYGVGRSCAIRTGGKARSPYNLRFPESNRLSPRLKGPLP